MTPAERRAILFLAAVALLGGLVRAVRAAGANADRPKGEQLALESQRAAVDSVARGLVRPRASRGRAGAAASPRPATKATPVGPVDVDQADAAALIALPRIGPVLAARIVADRDSLGPFGSLEALERVRGIGPAMIGQLAPHVTFSGTPRPLRASPNRPGAPVRRPRDGRSSNPSPARRPVTRRRRQHSTPTNDRSPATWPSPLLRPPSASATC